MFDNSELKKDILEVGQGFVDQDQANGKGVKAGVATATNKLDDSEVHIMPQKFLPAAPKKAVGGKQKVVGISVLLIVVLVAVVGGGIWYIMNQRTTPPATNAPVVTNTNKNDNTNDNTNDNVNDNTNGDITDDNINDNTNDNVNDNTNSNTNDNVNDNTNDGLIVVDAVVDGDLLTAAEELIYLTNPQKEDTDKDGFKDGQELMNLYDPLVPRNLLIDSGLVTVYSDANFDFKIFRPRSWNASVDEAESYKVLFLPDSESGEMIVVEAIPNDGEMTLVQFQQAFYIEEIYRNYTLGEQPALRTVGGDQVLVLINNNFFVITYETSGLTLTKDFNTTFEMMLNSFEPVKGLPEINE
jgi:hypothetical protein